MFSVGFIRSYYVSMDYCLFKLAFSMYTFNLGIVITNNDRPMGFKPDMIRIMLGFWHLCIHIKD